MLWRHAKCKNFPEAQLNTKRVEDIEGTNFNCSYSNVKTYTAYSWSYDYKVKLRELDKDTNLVVLPLCISIINNVNLKITFNYIWVHNRV